MMISCNRGCQSREDLLKLVEDGECVPYRRALRVQDNRLMSCAAGSYIEYVDNDDPAAHVEPAESYFCFRIPRSPLDH